MICTGHIQPLKRKKSCLFKTTWIELGGIMPSEKSQTKLNTAWYHFYMEPKK